MSASSADAYPLKLREATVSPLVADQTVTIVFAVVRDLGGDEALAVVGELRLEDVGPAELGAGAVGLDAEELAVGTLPVGGADDVRRAGLAEQPQRGRLDPDPRRAVDDRLPLEVGDGHVRPARQLGRVEGRRRDGRGGRGDEGGGQRAGGDDGEGADQGPGKGAHGASFRGVRVPGRCGPSGGETRGRGDWLHRLTGTAAGARRARSGCRCSGRCRSGARRERRRAARSESPSGSR